MFEEPHLIQLCLLRADVLPLHDVEAVVVADPLEVPQTLLQIHSEIALRRREAARVLGSIASAGGDAASWPPGACGTGQRRDSRWSDGH